MDPGRRWSCFIIIKSVDTIMCDSELSTHDIDELLILFQSWIHDVGTLYVV